MSQTTPTSSARYKVTKTTTDAEGKTQTETIEMVDEDAIRWMQNLRLNANDDRVGVRSLVDAVNPTAPPRAASKRAIPSQENKEFIQEALQVHNELRRKHGVAPLRLNSDLNKLAQQWANHLASVGSLVHSKTKYQNSSVGENLRCQSWPVTGKEMTEAWYNESQKYDYDSRRTYQSGTGHFTQVVWKNTQEVGFAQSQGSSMNFAVAMYFPAGNFLGEYEKNVFPPA